MRQGAGAEARGGRGRRGAAAGWAQGWLAAGRSAALRVGTWRDCAMQPPVGASVRCQGVETAPLKLAAAAAALPLLAPCCCPAQAGLLTVLMLQI